MLAVYKKGSNAVSHKCTMSYAAYRFDGDGGDAHGNEVHLSSSGEDEDDDGGDSSYNIGTHFGRHRVNNNSQVVNLSSDSEDDNQDGGDGFTHGSTQSTTAGDHTCHVSAA